MFGHREGRIERELKEIRELLDQMNVKLQEFRVPVDIRVRYTEVVRRLDRLIELSGKVHNLIEQEL